MTPQHHLPADIERTSLSIITAELEAQGLTPPPDYHIVSFHRFFRSDIFYFVVCLI